MKVDEMRDPSEKLVVESRSGLDAPKLKEPPPLSGGSKARPLGKRVRQPGGAEELGAYRAVLCCSFEVEPDQ